jgi:hypothetical protein
MPSTLVTQFTFVNRVTQSERAKKDKTGCFNSAQVIKVNLSALDKDKCD